MALVLADRVKETCTAPGTGTVTLLGASTGYQSFAVVGNGNTTYYCIADQNGSGWEVGIGTYTSSGTTLSRDTVLSSSNAGNKTNFSSGTQDVFLTYPSERSVYVSGTSIVSGSSASIPVASGGTGLTSLAAGYIPYGNGTNPFDSSASLTFDGTYLTAGSIKDSALTSGRVTYAGASGLLTDSANLTFDGTNLTVKSILKLSGSSSGYVALQGAAAAGSTTYTLPSADGSSGNVLSTNGSGVLSWSAAASGTVTSVSWTGGIVSVANGTTTPAFTIAGTSGGIPYFSNGTTWASSGELVANAIVLGGGAGVAPATTTTGTGVVTAIGNAVNTTNGLVTQTATLTASALLLGGGSGTGISSTTTGTGVVTALGVNTGTAGAFVVNGGALGTPSSGTVTNLTGTASININGTVGATTANTGAFTSITSTSASGISTVQAANQDGVKLLGRSAGSSGYLVTITPTTLTASRTVTLPDSNTTIPIASQVITFSGPTAARTYTLPDAASTLAALGTAQTFTATNTFTQVNYTNNAITASGNAATVPITHRLNTVTNNSAATLTITMTTTSAVDGQMSIVRILDASAVAQTISWTNTENSTVSVPTTSNGSTTLPLTVGFMYNNATSKWRCIASA